MVDVFLPSYTGNIAEWEWQHKEDNQPVNTYAFTYDRFSRLLGAAQYVDGVAHDRFIERGISYDRNGNMLTLQRYSGGALSEDIAYPLYNGNQLATMTRNGASHTFAYDQNGNCIADGQNALEIEYNYLNLVGAVKRNGAYHAKYRWAFDGTKLGVKNATGGYEYLGSLTYQADGTALRLKDAAFGSGRIIASHGTTTSYAPHYYTTDHRGSVRFVTSASGATIENDDYYPFGARFLGGGLKRSADVRHRFAGKEETIFGQEGRQYLDFGARTYNPTIGIWGQPDPLSEIRPWESPYLYCGGNPINRVDPMGLDWYEYDEEYEEDGEKKYRRQYKYVEGRMSRKEMQKNGYTKNIGLVAIRDGHYLSLNGNKVDVKDVNATIEAMQTDFNNMSNLDMYSHLNVAEAYFSEVKWDNSLPSTIDLQGQAFVVSTQTDHYLNINSRELKNQFNDYLYKTGDKYARYHPMNMPRLSGQGAMMFEFMVMNSYSPPGFPPSGLNYSTKVQFDRSNANSRMKYYRAAGLIR